MTLDLESFGDSPKKKSKTKYKAALGVGSVVSLFGIGSTLAANISLNGGGNVEFGQGVATTAACDENGFSVTPVTTYDNDHSIFRVEYVQVDGLDLTPAGTNWVDSGDVTDQNGVDGVNLTDALLQFPGQYYNGSDWQRTCDGVVLDFKAYTNDPEYALYTDDAYNNPSNTSTTSPVMWSQYFNDHSPELDGIYNPGFAVIFDSYNDEGSGYSYNYAIDGVDQEYWHGDPTYMQIGFNDYNSLWTSNASFRFKSDFNARPDAASISKITVQSMKEFPNSYYGYGLYFSGDYIDASLGNPSSGW